MANTDDVKSGIQQAASRAQDAVNNASDYYDNAADMTRSALDNLSDRVQEQPMTMLLVAAGIGYIAGRLRLL
ncbi:hypothetical protein SAMN05216548_101360 [Faunimonas pinastri]|uniref:DUF883 domain-containing protein n=1 Tax=Faunimonas pinastri TaxID=1855383 RepID=A0A1H9AAS9_9HYPH|nr:hypothetical protein [Faunimonas pinastri]SEP73108.1 hypothetical protein SAMN05216548_101360 [Faunimonas pinastri]